LPEGQFQPIRLYQKSPALNTSNRKRPSHRNAAGEYRPSAAQGLNDADVRHRLGKIDAPYDGGASGKTN
jgi:hypothetical protein